MVFVGFVISDVYNLVFCIIVVVFMGVGVILIFIYLFFMFWEMFYGFENEELVNYINLVDVEFWEVFIIGCLFVFIIGIGFYFKFIIQIYDFIIN